MKRRNFIFDIFSIGLMSSLTTRLKAKTFNITPMVRSISTWKTTEANLKAGVMLDQGIDGLTAAVAGVAIEEENPKNTTVGFGGAPDRTGSVTLDACVMNHLGDCGSVVAVENIVNVAKLARDVMEKTPHVMLAGKGAEEFGVSEGYEKINLLTEASKNEWKKWLENEEYKPLINIENHDTIGMLCLDKDNNMSGACTTSGLAYKMKGRVGDSPIIGSGLFIDNKIGGAVATGLGEEVVKTVGSFLVVELMRQGMSPQEACENAVNRIVSSNSQKNKFQVAYIAMNKNGEVGSFSIEPGFTYMDYVNGKNEEIKTGSAL
ncbi:MAG: N(4)-(beta-N-acetylglucosaminyl)-L-asparaginase [Cryomorphaceae bacterium]|jgi:N4-(beta-N-acetylglucosaminyl)-L-asparaginase|nr:N(4)-(beta-N-acetylglucosaminyl)-L-asparaginase [Cryomorphaceae bacterium]MBT3503229.1 N(4)-(beta-N-acetylglucosaminyl)-L-asparaginase [Cryomorphaceae bacterium]MBT3688749.1 N(4)-(beta-N-acetylglucosaminyl)-L-asparaginase [Cryomorphaceae bacterium]MBT4222377.1 N(4)-(beta-N-acetylglucosaminyl)-L-asparaginase [Cryomorphaceae bacterium]MBT4293848.1 N(4)-(beta-N-acetylglucosaminyl)-L-asparaginase [Cryomorphaceae bacterium]|tara:strand:+ start:737 stop:1693 length:957 start_codon:yes stop_codon:yes gene_type:complete